MKNANKGLVGLFAAALLALATLGAVQAPSVAKAEEDEIAATSRAELQAGEVGMTATVEEIDFHTVAYDEFGVGQKETFTVRNISDITSGYFQPYVQSGEGQSAFKVSSDKSVVPAGEEATITVELNPSYKPTKPGPIEGTLAFLTPRFEGKTTPTIKLKVDVSMPDAVTISSIATYFHSYCAPVDVSKVVAQTNLGPLTLGELGLTAPGIEPKSETGKYALDTSASPYTITNDDLQLSMEMQPATLVPRGVSASELKGRQPLSESTLSGAMANKNDTNDIVTGEFSWANESYSKAPSGYNVVQDDVAYYFTPADGAHYSRYTGHVIVTWRGTGNSAPTIRINGASSYVYDGKAHGVTVTTPSTGAQTITYNGKPDLPKDVGEYTVSVKVAETDAFAEGYATGKITITPATLQVPVTGVSKEYGEPAKDLPTKTVTGVNNESVTVALESIGNTQTQTPGTYQITGRATNSSNYHVTTYGGSFVVNQATPILEGLAASTGQAGRPLSSLGNPTATVRSKYLSEHVFGTIEWSTPSQPLVEGTYKYWCTFTPAGESLANYKKVTAQVAVTATAAPVVQLTVAASSLSFDYDASPKAVSPSSTTPGAKFEVTYTVNGRRQTTGPVNAGSYPYTVRAYVDGNDYADNTQSGTITIHPATPAGRPTVTGEDGTSLSFYHLSATGFTGVKGESLSGTVSWDAGASTPVVPGEAYFWTFRPSNSNYKNATGSIVVKPKAGTPATDRSVLDALVKEAVALRGKTTVSTNGANVPTSQYWVTQSVENTLESAINHAQRHLNDGHATQEEIDHSIQPLQEAMESYKYSMKPGTMVSGGGGGGGGGALPPVPEKKASTITLTPSVVRLNPGDDPAVVKISGEGDGHIIAVGTNDDIAFVDVRGTELHVTAKREGTAEVRVTRTATEAYEEASAMLVVVVGEAPEDFDPDASQPSPEIDAHPTYRLYNPATGEHLYTTDANEARVLATQRGWVNEGSNKTAQHSNTPVYRLYDTKTGEHLYTMDANEYRVLHDRDGWNQEGIAFYSDDLKAVPTYRLYKWSTNPVESHHVTTSAYERDVLVSRGWTYEGNAWFYVS